ncbi:UNVERIFIED_CONTAM: hypothetical protein HDU68_009001 [Siphonaria sp. JEL0065]|nr:hypothetical protein HDU68_008997 [Siphonaria sp. JEL0065]KAJ3030449.1 hypothetical protein HDU68_009001 [Siphonaria sp. JEL0065]
MATLFVDELTKLHASELGLTFTDDEITSTIQQIQKSLIANPKRLTLRDLNTLLIREYQRLRVISMGFNVTEAQINDVEKRLSLMEHQSAKLSLSDIENQRILILVEQRLKELGIVINTNLLWQLVDFIKSPTGVTDLVKKKKKRIQVQLGDAPVNRTVEELDDLILRFAIKVYGERFGWFMNQESELGALSFEIRNIVRPVSSTFGTMHLNKEFDQLLIHAAILMRKRELGLDGIEISEKEMEFAVKRLSELPKSAPSANGGGMANKLTKEEISNAIYKSCVKRLLKNLGLKVSETKLKAIVSDATRNGRMNKNGEDMLMKLIIKQRVTELKVQEPVGNKLDEIAKTLKDGLAEGKNRFAKGIDELLQ